MKNLKKVTACFLFSAAMTGVGSFVHAQELDYSADSNFGSKSLSSGFLPDPYTVNITSGGNVDLSKAIKGADCKGYATSNPDYKLQWGQDDPGLLKIWVESDEDTTLVINDSYGNWHCDDDSFGDLNPMVELDAAGDGRYDIWVGSYEANSNHSSVLHISELSNVSSSSSGSLDYSADSNFGSVSLAAGFWPDPHTVSITSGGNVDLSEAVPGEDCAGYATSNPDFKLRWEQDDPGLLKIWVESNEDTTLVINDSNGNWHCDDDSYGDLNPVVELNAAGDGRFDIWVGSYEANSNYSSTLYISEFV